MKITLTQQLDGAIATIMDAALKQGGWAMMQHVDVVRAAIREAQMGAIPAPDTVTVESAHATNGV